MKCAALTVVLTVLCGCSLMGPSKPDAADLGGGHYSVSGTTLSKSISSARQEAAAQAVAFCASSSRQAVIENFDDRARDAWGASTSSAVFYCK
jgi:hypothetical protein